MLDSVFVTIACEAMSQTPDTPEDEWAEYAVTPAGAAEAALPSEAPQSVNVSADLIRELKLIGATRPAWIEETTWAEVRVRELNYQQELAVHMAANGFKTKDIALQAGVQTSTVNAWLRDPTIKMEIIALQEKIHGKNIRGRLESYMHEALDTLAAIMRDPKAKESTKLQAVQYLLDQGIGKAKQELQVSGNLLADLLHRLDSSSPPEQDAKKLEEPKDALDNFAETFGQTHIVGVKSES